MFKDELSVWISMLGVLMFLMLAHDFVQFLLGRTLYWINWLGVS